MTSTSKRAWKLQEFVAHGASVNCLALGHKSGRVLVTGGDDKKVNLWAVGKPNCIMSLCGHTTPVECVRFGHTEELVCAGSQSGALKIWDLEAARLARTLTGHKAGLTCIDFHPYGDFLSSGSADTNLKLWDIRRKGCIFTYKGHSQRVNTLKFSPDGQWIASAGEEGAVKIWDLRAGKLMTEFDAHGSAVHDVEFHPHEFLLASASADRTVNFWDLESFQLVSTSERDSGPVRCITFHPEKECLFSASQDSFKVHLWEPSRISDSVSLGWGKVRDIAIASTQLIAASFQMSNVSIHVVDLKRVQPFCSGNRVVSTNNVNNHPPSGLRPNQHVRRSFVKEKARSIMKEEPNSDDKSGTDPEDSNTEESNLNINDVSSYENIFRPRRRELNRTPPNDPFEAPSGSETEGLNQRLLKNQHKKKPSPSPTRRTSQPMLPADMVTNGNNGSSYVARVRLRKSSQNNVATNNSSSVRPVSVYDTTSTTGTGQLAHSPTGSRFQRASSVQPRAAAELDYINGGDVSPPVLEHSRAQSLNRVPPTLPYPQQSQLANNSSSYGNNSRDFTPLTPVSRIQIGGNGSADKPLDRPTLVRPNRTSLQNLTLSPEQPQLQFHLQQQQHQHIQPQQKSDFGIDMYLPPQTTMRQTRMSQPDLSRPSSHNQAAPVPMQSPEYYQLQQPVQYQKQSLPDSTLDKEKFEVIPMNADKPFGIETNDFLPKKFQDSLSFTSTETTSRFSAYKGYQQQGELSESEVTSSILKGHESMMAVLATRGRNIEIIHKLWQNKDAKAAVEQAVSLNDQAVLVDLLSVITLRPSIWNLDLCTALLPPIGELLKSKYELYINTGCGAMKLILKNFASVIKSNIDSPVQTVGVDISREERHNKCMQCYRDLVKIRSLILKRQTMQGKMGHTYRELSILMQYLD